MIIVFVQFWLNDVPKFYVSKHPKAKKKTKKMK